jgi:hypothetical protein
VPRSQYFHLDRVPEWSERSIDQTKYRTTDGKLRGYVDKEWGHILQPLLEIEEFSIPAQQP